MHVDCMGVRRGVELQTFFIFVTYFYVFNVFYFYLNVFLHLVVVLVTCDATNERVAMVV